MRPPLDMMEEEAFLIYVLCYHSLLKSDFVKWQNGSLDKGGLFGFAFNSDHSECSYHTFFYHNFMWSSQTVAIVQMNDMSLMT